MNPCFTQEEEFQQEKENLNNAKIFKENLPKFFENFRKNRDFFWNICVMSALGKFDDKTDQSTQKVAKMIKEKNDEFVKSLKNYTGKVIESKISNFLGFFKSLENFEDQNKPKKTEKKPATKEYEKIMLINKKSSLWNLLYLTKGILAL